MWWKLTTNNAVSAARGFIDTDKYWLLLLAALFLIMVLGAPAQAQVLPRTNVPINGEIESLTLNDPTDVYSGGRMVVTGYSVILPKNLLIDLPANRLTLQQLFAQAPAGCVAAGQSGLAKTDTCGRSGAGGFATISAVRTLNGDIIAGDVFIQKGIEVVSGTVTYINYNEGWFRLNGSGSADTGVMVRLNDPDSRHTIQQGAGCLAGSQNCSPDPRFTLDPDNYVTTFSTGYPFCIPSTVPRTFPGLPAAVGIPAVPAGTAQANADGTGDLLCPSTNRTAVELETAADSRRFAPLKVGDPVTAEGNFETMGGVRFLSSHTTQIGKSMWTRNEVDQPDYLFLDEVFINAPGFENQRALGLFIGYTTMAPDAARTDVDIWSIHRDPATNELHEFPLASVQGCDAAGGVGTCSNMGLINAGLNIFRVRYDVDFILAARGTPGGANSKLSPCAHLQASTRFTRDYPGICQGGASLANNFGVLSPVPHEIVARTGHKLDSTTPLITLDVNGNQVPNGEYLFPLGLNLGGLEAAEFNEIDLNQMTKPVIFEGIPWNLDRRLSPSGCLRDTGCEATPQPLTPFPYTGLDPRIQADFDAVIGGATTRGGTPKVAYSDPVFTNSPLSNASDRVRSYVTFIPAKGAYQFDGNNTILPFTLAADPPSQGVNDTPAAPLTMACMASPIGPVAQNDTAVALPGVPLAIDLTANDIPVFGFIDTASVATGGSPAGSVEPGILGRVTYTAAANFNGTDTFTYTVRDFFGALSNTATVTVRVLGPPIASPDSASTNRRVPVVIPVLANDTSPLGDIDPTSVRIESQGASGTGVVNANGTITYTPNADVLSGTDNALTYSVANTSRSRSNIAAVTVTIINVDTVPLALNDSAVAPANTAVIINVLANDTAFGATLDPATVNPTVPGHGTAITDAATGSVTYTPAADYTGPDSFTYTVRDNLNQSSNIATVSINVATTTPVANPDSATTLEDTPVVINLTANDTDGDGNLLPSTVTITSQPANGTITNPATGSVTYTPRANFNGTDTFSYTVRDALGAISNAALVTVTITAVNDPPVAANDVASTVANTSRTINLVVNDTDVDGTVVAGTVAIVSGPANGVVTNPGTGSVTYTPNAGFTGIDTFTYTVRDDLNAVSAPATVTVNVTSAGTVAVLQAQFRTVSATTGDWRVEGTATPNAVVTIRVGRDLTGAIVGTQTADGGGRWRFQAADSTVLPGPTNTISVSTGGGASRLAFPVSVR